MSEWKSTEKSALTYLKAPPPPQYIMLYSMQIQEAESLTEATELFIDYWLG